MAATAQVDPLDLWQVERRIWKLPTRLPVSRWVEQSIVIPAQASSMPGRWNNNWVPYLREPMDALSDPDVEQITMMTAAQVGKTSLLINYIGYLLEQDPSPALLVMPREEDVLHMLSKRVRPTIEESPRLRRLLSDRKADNTAKVLSTERMALYGAGANSPADLASRPIRVLLGDELDKWPNWAGREADPLSLAKMRTQNFPDRKFVVASTPTTQMGLIWQQWEKSDQRRYWVPCIHCGFEQKLVLAQLRWPKGADGHSVDADLIQAEDLAHYECERCGGRISDGDKRTMMLDGQWRAEAPENQLHRGYTLSSLYSPWVPFSRVAAEFVRSHRDRARLMNFTNSWLGETFDEVVERTDGTSVEGCKADYEDGVVPGAVRAITAGVDVGKPFGLLRLHYVIRGWGDDGESWLIRAGVVESWEALENVLFRTPFQRRSAKEEMVPMLLACIDSGYDTDTVYEFCRKWRHVARAIKGKAVIESGEAWTVLPVERDRSGKRKRFGLRLWNLNTHFFKTKLMRLIHTEPGGLGEWHVHSGVSRDYCEQVASEQLVKKANGTGVEWRVKPGSPGNHYLDAEVYALAAAEMKGATVLRPDGAPMPVASRPAGPTRPLKLAPETIAKLEAERQDDARERAPSPRHRGRPSIGGGADAWRPFGGRGGGGWGGGRGGGGGKAFGR